MVANRPDQQPAATTGQLTFIDSTEAANALGISLDALHKRIRRGTVEAIKEDGHWLVKAPTGHDQPPPDNRPAGQPVDGVEAMKEQIHDLRNQLMTMGAALTTSQGQVTELTTVIRQQQAMLQAAPKKAWWKIW